MESSQQGKNWVILLLGEKSSAGPNGSRFTRSKKASCIRFTVAKELFKNNDKVPIEKHVGCKTFPDQRTQEHWLLRLPFHNCKEM